MRIFASRAWLLTGIAVLASAFAATRQAAAQAPGSDSAPTPAAPASTRTAPPPTQTIDPAKEADIRRLFEVMNLKQMQDQIMTAGLDAMHRQFMANQAQDERSQEFVNLLMAKLRKKFREADLTSLMVPIYDKYYSDDEIKQLTAFYGTPLGQKVLTVLPKITEDGMAAGMRLGQRLGEESAKEVFQEHPEFAPRSQ